MSETIPEQLELVDVGEDNGPSWQDWFLSLPAAPGSEETVGDRLAASEERSGA